MTRPRCFAAVTALTVLTVFTAVMVWARVIVPADPAAWSALDSDDSVIVSRQPWIEFRPRDNAPTAGVIFYPGGKIEPAAYAPILRRMAARGYLVVLTPMPLNVALLAPGRAGAVIRRTPRISRWVIAGHSLGGDAAADFAEVHGDKVAGLILWAAYPAAFTDLSATRMPVLSVAGSEDDLTTPDKVRAARARLPVRTVYVEVAGATHWSFGSFGGNETEDGSARRLKQDEILDATLSFLESVAPAAAES